MLGRPRAGWPPGTLRLTALSAVSGLVIAAVTAVLAGPWDDGQRTAERERAAAQGRTGDAYHGRKAAGRPEEQAAPYAPAVLAGLGPEGATPAQAVDGVRPQRAPLPSAAGLAAALGPLLKDPALGSLRSAAVWDVASGTELYGSRAGAAAIPASVTKLASATAALSALGPDHRIPTVTRLKGTTLYLVGGGDPTLTPRALDRLAKATARALPRGGAFALRYDTSAYSGPVRHPIGVNDNVAPVTALMVNEGRLDGSSHGPAPRSGDPAGEAARLFATRLADHGVKLTGAPAPAEAPAKAGQLAAVHSAPLGALVERALTNSDNDLAEALARQTAIAAGGAASFSGASRAVTAELARLGLPVKGARFADGSGLDRRDHASAEFFARLLVLAGHPAHPGLRPVLTGLPVAGFSGTLDDRYGDAAGAGVVRAKTGTLTGVNSLAGTVVDADGRLLAFAFLTNGTPNRDTAQHTLDTLASTLTRCGCR
ncbi:D-alanyl-D-alanine carboxypeptidase/D-alanyl-D-alanine-endopeptidase [Streptomyces sp. NPDC051940]|uniref:D-alanyl-D-alanine carboxypeptidase/D-alanyl-D-alanine endopeptidase n=1 Tax=Streptomyces sp. NPDC051940 TaxID=3155675 RepID=UPI00341C5BF4